MGRANDALFDTSGFQCGCFSRSRWNLGETTGEPRRGQDHGADEQPGRASGARYQGKGQGAVERTPSGRLPA